MYVSWLSIMNEKKYIQCSVFAICVFCIKFSRYFWHFHPNFCKSMISFGPVVYPPAAPPSALPIVQCVQKLWSDCLNLVIFEVFGVKMTKFRSRTKIWERTVLLITVLTPSQFCNSSIPLPFGPMKPVAWHSSIINMALYFSHKAPITSKGATSPSIEKTPSVTTSLRRQSWVFWSCSSSSAMSRCWYLARLALQSRTPSMIEAWFKESEMTASSGPRRTSKMPALASKHDG